MNVIRNTLLVCIGISMATTTRAQEAPAAGDASKPPPWEVSGNAGFTSTSGNSDTLLATAGIVAKRMWADSDLNLGLDGAYGETDNVRNVQTVRGYGQYDHKMSERTFWYGRAELLHDGIADIEYRLTLGPGAGYYFIKKENLFLRGEFGPSWVYERKGNTTLGYFAVRFAERFEYKISDRAKLYQALEWLPQVDRWNNYVLNFEAGVESALTDKLSLTFAFINNYVNEPAPGRERNDTRFIAGLKYRFL